MRKYFQLTSLNEQTKFNVPNGAARQINSNQWKPVARTISQTNYCELSTVDFRAIKWMRTRPARKRNRKRKRNYNWRIKAFDGYNECDLAMDDSDMCTKQFSPVFMRMKWMGRAHHRCMEILVRTMEPMNRFVVLVFHRAPNPFHLVWLLFSLCSSRYHLSLSEWKRPSHCQIQLQKRFFPLTFMHTECHCLNGCLLI